jgi:hypothetical protein
MLIPVTALLLALFSVILHVDLLRRDAPLPVLVSRRIRITAIAVLPTDLPIRVVDGVFRLTFLRDFASALDCALLQSVR